MGKQNKMRSGNAQSLLDSLTVFILKIRCVIPSICADGTGMVFPQNGRPALTRCVSSGCQ